MKIAPLNIGGVFLKVLQRPVAVVLVSFTLLVADPALAQWASLGRMPRPRTVDHTLIFHGRQAVVSVTAVTSEIIRVRFAPGHTFGRDHSYAVTFNENTDPGATFDVRSDSSSITTRKLRVNIRHAPFRIGFSDAAGKSIDEDDPEKGIAYSGQSVRVWKRLQDDAHVYGLGEKNGQLDKRGRQLGGYAYAMWNSDTFAYHVDVDPIYVSVPFFIVLENHTAYGIFLDNTFRTSFDIGKSSPGLLSFGAEGGDLNYYFIYGPGIKDVVARYTTLTGRMPLPPRWALGYQQSRYSYFPAAGVRSIAENFRIRRIPVDAVWLDIDYQDGYEPFTWNNSRFPDPAGLIRDLLAQGIRIVTVVDPHPKKEPGHEPYDSGLAGDHFVRNRNGTIYEGAAWPSRAETDHHPGLSVFPDFSRPLTREWWGSLYAPLINIGVAGIWNDMNEPAVLDTPTGTMPLDVRHDNEGQPTDHREIHNVYGMLMSRATWEGLLKLRPARRPFVLTRASFAGGQRYAALWSGDSVSDWAQLRSSIPMLAGMGLSGFPLVGGDIGGFADGPTAELFTRWLQLGVFYPFMRTHTNAGNPDQEPWSYGAGYEDLNRQAIELRYELLPHIYNVMHEASETGVPALRPLVLEFPDDPKTYSLDDEFMFGSDLLIAPVLREGANVRSVYLPAGVWHDFWSGKSYDGGVTIPIPVTLASIPIFIRAGAFIFSQPVVQHTDEMPGQPMQVTLYPGTSSEASFYEDDGETMNYARGISVRRRFSAQAGPSNGSKIGNLTVRIGMPEGSFRPMDRDLMLSIKYSGEPARVLVNGAPLSRSSDLKTVTLGWTTDESGFVIVKLPDRFDPVSVIIEAS